MSLCLTPRIESLTSQVTGRRQSFFAPALAALAKRPVAQVAGARILVAGGAGSIGSATIQELVAQGPAALAVLDPSENNLAELLRTLRSGSVPAPASLDVQPLDYGSQLARRWLERQKPFDLVLSFAALKHVRSERDEFSLLRMLEVNLVAADRFLAACRQIGHGKNGVFLVSTDKAADPVSLMGASKRAMELLLWAHTVPGAPASLIDGGTADALTRATSVRFANVAFSDGSLPWGFLQRLEKRQPLAGPSDIRRYLVSPREAGQLCLLAALGAPHRHVLIPELDPKRDTVTFRAIADAVLAERGLRPVEYSDAAAARAAVDRDIAHGGWPVVFLPSDTSGEKDIEVFAAPNEATTACGLPGCLAIPGLSPNQQALSELLTLIDGCCRLGQPVPDKPTLTNAMSLVVRELRHHEAGRSLDSKM